MTSMRSFGAAPVLYQQCDKDGSLDFLACPFKDESYTMLFPGFLFKCVCHCVQLHAKITTAQRKCNQNLFSCKVWLFLTVIYTNANLLDTCYLPCGWFRSQDTEPVDVQKGKLDCSGFITSSFLQLWNLPDQFEVFFWVNKIYITACTKLYFP